MTGTISQQGYFLRAEGFTGTVELWIGLRTHFITRRPVRVEAGPRGWSYPETTNLEIAQVAAILDAEVDRRRASVGVVRDAVAKWREWTRAFRAHVETADPRAAYPLNEGFWLDVSRTLTVALSVAELLPPGGSWTDSIMDAGGWVWDHKRWLWPVPVASVMSLAAGELPKAADFVPGLDLAGAAAGNAADAVKDSAASMFSGLTTPLLIGAAVVGGLIVLPALLRD